MAAGEMAPAVLKALRAVSVEPVMLVDGACNQAMLLFIENVQMNKICSINLGLPDQVTAIHFEKHVCCVSESILIVVEIIVHSIETVP